MRSDGWGPAQSIHHRGFSAASAYGNAHGRKKKRAGIRIGLGDSETFRSGKNRPPLISTCRVSGSKALEQCHQRLAFRQLQRTVGSIAHLEVRRDTQGVVHRRRNVGR